MGPYYGNDSGIVWNETCIAFGDAYWEVKKVIAIVSISIKDEYIAFHTKISEIINLQE